MIRRVRGEKKKNDLNSDSPDEQRPKPKDGRERNLIPGNKQLLAAWTTDAPGHVWFCQRREAEEQILLK